MDLTGKTALITGATSGLGKAITEALHKEGAGIVLTGLGDPAEIQAQLDALRKANTGPVHFFPCDLRQPHDIDGLVQAIQNAGVDVDILVNNAGTQHICPLETFPAQDWDRVIAVNLSAPFHLTRALIGGMKARKWGRIINIASVHGLVGSDNKSAYIASKHGLVGLTKVAALEGAGHGVTCNAICPGWIMTPLSARQISSVGEREGLSFEEARVKLLKEKQPSMEFATLEEVAGLALYLCSGSANQMTGTALPIDGGWTAQ